ncbi:hypothetical protein RRG08_056818 [Elysia crispata]|uniref:Uncharacterized protein n=1 Tax=Elysia crispata TaxID=231223 RepID=A0AAE1DW31_9GAST|nr:hypothetical protein RRG08_056818 [Elysia crispata]
MNDRVLRPALSGRNLGPGKSSSERWEALGISSSSPPAVPCFMHLLFRARSKKPNANGLTRLKTLKIDKSVEPPCCTPIQLSLHDRRRRGWPPGLSGSRLWTHACVMDVQIREASVATAPLATFPDICDKLDMRSSCSLVVLLHKTNSDGCSHYISCFFFVFWERVKRVFI